MGWHRHYLLYFSPNSEIDKERSHPIPWGERNLTPPEVEQKCACGYHGIWGDHRFSETS